MAGSRLADAKRALCRLLLLFSVSPAGKDAKEEDGKQGAAPTAATDADASSAARLRWTKAKATGLEDARQTATDSNKGNTQETTETRKTASPENMSFGKENVPPVAELADLAAALEEMDVKPQLAAEVVQGVEEDDPEKAKAKQQNLRFISEALDMARLALRTNETPVGCVLVHEGRIIAKGMNATNVTRNGTRHAEFMAIGALLSVAADERPPTTPLKPKPSETGGDEAPNDCNEDGSKDHLYPYGQKLMTERCVDPAILKESTLYVTVEPCVMCASMLRQMGIRKVYFGAVNDKFGGTGGVFSIHANSLPVGEGGETAAAHPLPRQQVVRLPDGSGTLGMSYTPGGGDGGNVEDGYDIEGGWGRDEAVGLLRRFYVQENGRAPVPRKKEGRAARLAAMMEQDDNAMTCPLGDVGSANAASEAQEPMRTTPGGGGAAAAGSDPADHGDPVWDDDDDDDGLDGGDAYLGLAADAVRRGGDVSLMPGNFAL